MSWAHVLITADIVGSAPIPCLHDPGRVFPYETFYESIIQTKKEDKSYRYFRNIRRLQNEFPFAQCPQTRHKVNVWCSNDYVGTPR